jgi:uncharacterized protein YjbJ (UPF0337 family)
VAKDGIDGDRIDGSAKNLGGKIKEGIGNLTGDAKLKREGEADQIKGKAQNAIGGIKDSAREALDGKDRL